MRARTVGDRLTLTAAATPPRQERLSLVFGKARVADVGFVTPGRPRSEVTARPEPPAGATRRRAVSGLRGLAIRSARRLRRS